MEHFRALRQLILKYYERRNQHQIRKRCLQYYVIVGNVRITVFDQGCHVGVRCTEERDY